MKLKIFVRKRLGGILLFVVLGTIAGCQDAGKGETPPLLEDTPVASESTINFNKNIDTQTPEPIASQLALKSIVFPYWVSDPEIELLLVPILKGDEPYASRYQHLALINPKTGDRFDLPNYDDGGYFWTVDGNQVGILSKDQKTITLIDTRSGEIDLIMPPAGSTAYIPEDSGKYIPNSYTAYGEVDSEDFLLLSDWYKLSADGKYLWDPGFFDATENLTILDLETNSLIDYAGPEEGVFNIETDLSPAAPLVAVSQTNAYIGQLYMPYGDNVTTPNFWVSVFDVRKDIVLYTFEGVTDPVWSPNGVYFLFQPWADGWIYGSPPCILELASGIRTCFNDFLSSYYPRTETISYFTHLDWSPNQTKISFIYTVDGEYLGTDFGGLCIIDLVDMKMQCMLEEFEDSYELVYLYNWSPSGNHIAFSTNMIGPISHESDAQEIGIANSETGEYFLIGHNMGTYDLGLWQPIGEP